MIIECNNCLKKFTVSDSDIPDKGRTVQCGNCSAQWFQKPIIPSVRTDNLAENKVHSKISSSSTANDLDIYDVDQEPSKNEFKASDGKNYKFLGNQWAEVLPSGKAGRLARKKISKELNNLTGREQVKKNKTIKKSNQLEIENQYQEIEPKGMGIFSFLVVLIIFVAAIILLLDTFKNQLIPFFPDLDNYLVYIFETLINIYIIIKDLFISYK